MGSYVFTWEHPANEVFVTGTFDNWSKTEKLTKRDEGHFDKTVHFKSDHDRILYKFVVDGNWTVNHTLPQLEDGTGNVNNVLYPHEITPAAGSAALSNVAPGSTTALLAGATPKESGTRETPGAFPETPAFETPSATEHPGFNVAPIPASTGMGNPVTLKEGEAVPHPSTLTSNTIGSNVKLDKESYEQPDRGVTGGSFASISEPAAFSVTPLPATGGIHNPVTLKEGEAVPHPSTLTSDTIGSNVKLDKESYEHADRGVAGTSADNAFTVPPVTSSMIPESSLPMGLAAGPAANSMFTQSAGANSTTSGFAGNVPLEPRGKATIIDDGAETVPAIVTDSQKSAHVDPEASGNPVAVSEKRDVENEIKSKVQEVAPASNSASLIPSSNQISTAALGTAVAAGVGITGAFVAAKSYLPTSIQNSIDAMNRSTSTNYTEDKTAMERESESKVASAEAAVPSATTSTSIPVSSVPNPVKESLSEAHADAEAASNEEAVQEKSTMERELQSKLARDDSVGESAPVIAPSAAAHSSALSGTAGPGAAVVASIPKPVTDSLQKAHADAEAAANPEAVQEKSAVEKELTSKISPVTSAGEPAPTVSAATTSTSPLKQADATTLGALEGKSTDLGTAATLPPTESSHATPFALGAGGASAIAAGVVAAPVVHSFASKDSAGKSTPQVTTGIETTPTTVTTTGSSAPSTPSKKVTDPAAPVKDQGALKAANAASPVKTPTANRQSQDVGSPSSTHTDASGKKKKRFSVFMDKLKDKLR